MFRLYSLAIGYCIGLVQTAYIVGQLFAKIDIRDHGSGNAGTTNTVRVMGPKLGFVVFVLDILKGIFGYMLCSWLFGGSGTFIDGYLSLLPGLYGGLGVILGHAFPFYLKFKGGKGVASALGIILCTDIRVALSVYFIGVIVTALTRYISAASLMIVLALPFGMFIAGYSSETIGLCAVITCLVWYFHRENIKRLLSGTENKFNFKKQV